MSEGNRCDICRSKGTLQKQGILWVCEKCFDPNLQSPEIKHCPRCHLVVNEVDQAKYDQTMKIIPDREFKNEFEQFCQNKYGPGLVDLNCVKKIMLLMDKNHPYLMYVRDH